jgi:hypothetical protein
MKYVYLLNGSSGVWEDTRDWVVKAYHSERDALDHRQKIVKVLDEFGNEEAYCKRTDNTDLHGTYGEYLEAALQPLDPMVDTMFGQPHYWISKVELQEEE